ncbi:MAG: response regulator transcription factor [Bacteroidales bacterium]|nr:response regulator transcription factor [Bacteroidales bacterium]
MAIKILIADDHQLFREGLITLLTDSNDIKVVDQAKDGKEALEKAREQQPDILIMDIGMPIISGIEATGILKKEFPNIKVIALTMHSEKHFIKGMLEAGADGYLFKDCPYDELIHAIDSVFQGKKYLSDEITGVIIQDYVGKHEDILQKDPLLSERELEILKLFAEGKSSREIADTLFVSVKTVGTHKQHILNKLNLNSTADMVKYAIKKGLISLW